MEDKPFQRLRAKSNAHVGKEFELIAKDHFIKEQNILLEENYKVDVGIGLKKKVHSFDLGSASQKIIVECKSHRWTTSGNVPSAKLSVWNEAMYYFYTASNEYRKIMFVLYDFNVRRHLSLAAYYLATFAHLIPVGIEFWEYDDTRKIVMKVTVK